MSTILLVEDDGLLLGMYSDLLTSEGYMILTAKDGEEGLKIASENKIELFLLDVMMPRMDGLELLKNLRNNPEYKETPVIVLTNQVDPREKDVATELGAREYLVKAKQSPEEVVVVVKKYLPVSGNSNCQP